MDGQSATTPMTDGRPKRDADRQASADRAISESSFIAGRSTTEFSSCATRQNQAWEGERNRAGPIACGASTPEGAAAEQVDDLRESSAEERALPPVLERTFQEQLRRRLIEEYQPSGATETLLVHELARHAAASEKWDQGVAAVARQTALLLPAWLPGMPQAADVAAEDAGLAAALTVAAADRCERHSLHRSRAFLKTLERLESLQNARRAQRGLAMPPLGFADEAACERYLADRWLRGAVRCPHCRAKQGRIFSRHKCWECRICKRQSGIRATTIMSDSPLPLRLWFDAIRHLLWCPALHAAQLATRIGILRVATVRSMIEKIRLSLAAEDGSSQLAGLDRYFADQSDRLSQASSATQIRRPPEND
ncbi:MAG: hypothetical protein K8U03_18155 [Planctomycetia bacterium]|nr:hypothetical protein [Planctomycetia bacterium]